MPDHITTLDLPNAIGPAPGTQGGRHGPVTRVPLAVSPSNATGRIYVELPTAVVEVLKHIEKIQTDTRGDSGA